MLDIKFIRENPEFVQQAAKNKKVDIDVTHILEIDKKRQELQKSLQSLQEKRNVVAKSISGKPTQAQIEKGRKIKEKLEKEEHAYTAVKEELEMLLDKVFQLARMNQKT